MKSQRDFFVKKPGFTSALFETKMCVCIYSHYLGILLLEVLKMDEKRNMDFFNKIFKMLEKKSFYIMIVLCIGIVVFAGLFVTSRNIISSISFDPNQWDQEQEMQANASDEEDVQNTATGIEPDISLDAREASRLLQEESKLQQSSSIIAIEKETKQDKNVTNMDVDTTTKPEVQAKKKELNFELPVFGNLQKDYSVDKPVFSKTLNSWRSHKGVDIEAALGTPIKAVEDGVVIEVTKDPRYGNRVVIQHDESCKTVYASLGDGVIVKEKQKIKKGEVIGSVGNTAQFESLEPPHLHFEVWVDEKNVDPKAYLPQLAS